jgi:hypothetical protein
MKKIFLLLVLMSFSSALLADLDDFADYLEFSKCKQTINLSAVLTGPIRQAIEGGDNFYIYASEIGPLIDAVWHDGKMITKKGDNFQVTYTPKNAKLVYKLNGAKTGFEFTAHSLQDEYVVQPDKETVSINGKVSYGPPEDADLYNFKASYNEINVHSFPLTKKGKNFVYKGEMDFNTFSIKVNNKGRANVKISGPCPLRLFCQVFYEEDFR